MSSALRAKSVTALRTIADSFGVRDIFNLDKAALIQAIEAKRAYSDDKKQRDEIDRIVFRQKDFLSRQQPVDAPTELQVLDVLEPCLQRGLRVSFEGGRWYMECGGRTDEGSLTMPLRVIVECAGNILKEW